MGRLEDLEHENAVLLHKVRLLNSAWRMSFSASTNRNTLRMRVDHILDINALAQLPSARDYTTLLLENQAVAFARLIDERVRIHGPRSIEDDSVSNVSSLDDLDLTRDPLPPQPIILRSACGGRRLHSISSYHSKPREIRVPILRTPRVYLDSPEPMTLQTAMRTFEYAGQDSEDLMALRYDEVIP